MNWLNDPQNSHNPFYFGPLAGYEKEAQKAEEAESEKKSPEEIKEAWKRDLGETRGEVRNLWLC